MTGRFGASCQVVCLTLLLILTSAGAAAGQAVRSGSIGGTITDETGAALPGVAVTLTSPALQVSQLVKVPLERGEYQFVDLPAGTYRPNTSCPLRKARSNEPDHDSLFSAGRRPAEAVERLRDGYRQRSSIGRCDQHVAGPPPRNCSHPRPTA